ncbi:hypothetical protein ACFE04_029031 [Oxalis oulophora]
MQYAKKSSVVDSRDGSPAWGSVINGQANNNCVILPVNVIMEAQDIERRKKNWYATTKTASDLIVQIGDTRFYLHKLPMVARSGYLNRLVFQKTRNQQEGSILTIQIDNLPGGAESFQLLVKFCYGWNIELTPSNIAPLYCAAHFLELTNDLQPENLIFKAEVYLSFVLLSSWKGIFQILKSCELVSSQSKELQIVKRCSEAIAWKSSLDTKSFSSYDDHNTENLEDIAADWWFEEVSLLRIDHFIKVIEATKSKGMKPELVGSCITHWTEKWFSRSTIGLENLSPIILIQKLQRITIESLIRILPTKESSISCNFLLRLLKVGSLIKIDHGLLKEVERRIAAILVQCCVADLVVINHGESNTMYDVKIVIRVVKCFVSDFVKQTSPGLFVVAKLIDGYLTVIARDQNLSAKTFQELAEALPENARHTHDQLYRAMDMYLKAHPRLSEEERTGVCRAMNHHKLSQEALRHVMINGRLPAEFTTGLIIVEKVNMVKPMAVVVGSNYQRIKVEAIIGACKGSDKEWWISSQKEIKMIKSEVEMMKGQLNKLQKCKLEIQKQVKRCLW